VHTLSKFIQLILQPISIPQRNYLKRGSRKEIIHMGPLKKQESNSEATAKHI